MKRGILVLVALIFILSAYAQTTEVVEIPTRPWNGYWWPYKYGGLCTGNDYNNHPSPMEKYDVAFNQPYLATWWECGHHYRPDGKNWWGHCNGWAAASILEPEPTGKHTYNGIVFYVGDIKGFLTELHQGATGQIYGTRYDGDDNQAAFEDINPLDLQNVLEMYLKDNQLPILLDTDPTEEIWTYPVYKYELTYTDENNVRHSTLKIYCATDGYDDGILDPDDSGDTHVYTKTYTYDLTLDSNGEPVSGVWTGDSINDHPDFAWYPEIDRQSNPYITKDNISEILSHSYSQDEDDGNEPDNNFTLAKTIDTNKIYRIKNDDYFKLFIEPGEDIEIFLSFNDFFNYATGKVFDINKNFLNNFNFNDKQSSYIFPPVEQITDYFVEVEYPLEGNYNDNYMLKVEENNQKIIIPHTLNTDYWDNFIYAAFIPYTVKDTETEEETEYTSATGTLLGINNSRSTLIQKDVQFNAGFKELNINTNNETPQWIKVNTLDSHIKLLSFYQSQGDGSMGYFYSIPPANHFVLPHVPPQIHYWWYGLVLVNPSHFKTVRVWFKLYNYNRQVLKEGYIDLPAYGKIVDVFENIFPDVNMEETSYLEFFSKDNIVVSALYGTRDHRQLAYVPADSKFIKNGERVYFSLGLMPQTNNPWAGIAIVNPSDTTAYCTVSVVDNHSHYHRYTMRIYAHEKKVDVIENFLPDDVSLSDTERIEIDVLSGEISAFSLYGDHQKGILASCLPIELNQGMITTYFPYISNHNLNSILYIKNENNYSAQVKVYAINEYGEETQELTVNLSNFELKAINIDENFTDTEHIKTLKVYSSKFITPFITLTSDDGKYYEIIGPDFKKETILTQQ